MVINKYPWYTIVGRNDALSQGDFFDNCPVVVPSTSGRIEEQNITADVLEYDVVVMSQSCDLILGKLDLVTVCPVWPLRKFAERDDYIKSSKGKKALKRGYIPRYHLLNKSNLRNFEKDFLLVDFRTVYGVPFKFLEELGRRSGQRLRLLPPYREHLSQAFARFFMRVGLPIDLPDL